MICSTFSGGAGELVNHSISVVAYIYNYAHYLEEAIRSILEQTVADFELYILDDGSTDQTYEVLQPFFADPRVRYEVQANRGRDRLHETFNRCLEATTGDLIVIANGDDVMHPQKLEKQRALFEQDPDLDILYHDMTLIDAAGNELPGEDASQPEERFFRQGLLGRTFFCSNLVPNPTVMFRRSILRRVGLQETGWMHDTQFWLKAAMARCRFGHLPEALLRYRVHEESHSTSSQRRARIVAEYGRMRREMRARYRIEEIYPEILAAANPEEARFFAHLELGNGLASHSSFEMACDEYRMASTCLPEQTLPQAVLLNNLGVALLKSGSLSEGVRTLRQALALQPHPTIRENAARAIQGVESDYQLLLPGMPDGFGEASWIRAEIPEASILSVLEPGLSLAESVRRPDVLLVPDGISLPALPEGGFVQRVRSQELEAVFLGQLLHARGFLPLGNQPRFERLARERGCPVLRGAEVPARRKLRLPARPERFFAFPDWEGEGWRSLVRRFVETFRFDAPVTLSLWVDPSIGFEEVFGRIAEELTDAGFDPEIVPDLELFSEFPPECTSFIPGFDSDFERRLLERGLAPTEPDWFNS